MPSPSVLARPVVIYFGKRVRERRIAAGLTQRQLAERARMKNHTVSLVERGETAANLITMVLIAEALGCGIIDLMPQSRESLAMFSKVP